MLFTLGGCTFATRFGLTEFPADLAPGSPATGEVFSAVLPTYKPGGSSELVFAESPPFPEPEFAPTDAGVPDAPAWPSGVAANDPRRFPAGGSGGAPTAGFRLKAITRPCAPNDAPDADADETEGGGATTCGRRGSRMPGSAPGAWFVVRATGSCGAGAITALAPMLISPSRAPTRRLVAEARSPKVEVPEPLQRSPRGAQAAVGPPSSAMLAGFGDS